MNAVKDLVRKISSISSLEELDGYESEAKKRGMTGDELVAAHNKRKELTPKKRRSRK